MVRKGAKGTWGRKEAEPGPEASPSLRPPSASLSTRRPPVLGALPVCCAVRLYPPTSQMLSRFVLEQQGLGRIRALSTALAVDKPLAPFQEPGNVTRSCLGLFLFSCLFLLRKGCCSRNLPLSFSSWDVAA